MVQLDGRRAVVCSFLRMRGRTSARRQGLEPTHGQRAFSQDWGPEEPRAARGSGAFTRSDEQHARRADTNQPPYCGRATGGPNRRPGPNQPGTPAPGGRGTDAPRPPPVRTRFNGTTAPDVGFRARRGSGAVGDRGERDGSQCLEAASCLLTRTSPGQITSQVTRCTQKGHGFLRAEACDACENADEGNRADDPHTLRAAHQPTSLVGTTPLAAAKSLDGLRGRGQELEAAHLRGRAQQMTASHRADERSPAAQEATELLRYGDNGLRESRLRLDGGAALLLQSILPLCMAHLLVLFGGRTCCLHCGKHQAD